MYLKAIELIGFKSFAVRTRLEFSPGMTAIVGPNGSGKSNLTDAVRWVLGEQSSKTLRGQQMGDLIFSGSSEHRAVGMAEVQLIFDNGDYALPLPQAEVVVTRRVFRDGGGEYQINGRNCRLREIVELFTDTGLGRSSFAIIGQGQIDRVLDERPEERRGIFEEASGIAGHRQRKTEARKRLDKVDEQLVRVQDLLQVLDENELALAQQAEEARMYLDCRDRLRHLEFTVYYQDVVQQAAKMAVLQRDLEQAESALVEGANQLSLLEAEMALQRQKLTEAEARQQEANQAVWQSRQDQERILGEQNLWMQRLDQLREQQLQRQNESVRLQQQLQQSEQELHQLENAATEYRFLKSDMEKQLDEKRQALSTVEEQLRTLLAEQSQQRQQHLEQQRLMMRREAHLEQMQQRLQQLELQMQQGQEQETQAEAGLREQQAQLLQQQEVVQGHADELARLRSQIEQIQLLRSRHEQERQQLRQAYEEKKQERASQQSRWRILQSMEEQREGYQRAVQQLLAARDRGEKPLRGLIDVLSRVISVPSERELAIEIALGGAAQNLVVESEQAAELAIAWLKEKKAGRATFLPLDVRLSANSNQGPRFRDPPAGFIGMASDLVECEERFRALVNRQLGRILVMQDLPSALQYARSSGYRERIVTLQGEQLYAGGSLSGGSAPRRDSSPLARPRLLTELQQQLELLETQLQEMEARLRQEEQRAREDALQEADHQERETAAEQQLARAREGLRDIEREYEASEQRRAERKRQLTERQQEQAELLRGMEELKRLVAERDEQTDTEAAYRRREEELRTQQQSMIAEESALQSKAEHLLQTQGQNAVRLQNLQRQSLEWRQQLALIAEAEAKRVEQEAEYRSQRHGAEDRIIAEEEKQLRLEGELKDLAAVRVERATRIEAMDKQLTTLRRNDERMQRRCNELRLQKVRQEDEAAYLERRLAEEHQLSPLQLLEAMDERLWLGFQKQSFEDEPSQTRQEALSPEREDMPEEGFRDEPLQERRRELAEWIGRERAVVLQRMQQLRQELASLGHVHLGAIEELQHLRERIDLLRGQSDDLRQAGAELEELILSLEKLMARQFRKTIEEVGVVFQQLFSRLFNGGEAQLYLSNRDDPLAGGVGIRVRLPGKTQSSLVLLSGGERALTALALLLAVTQVKAPPFCLLDEVETALDEANLERLAMLLTTISESCQLLVITHRRPTMEAAASLIGITMQTRGVSTALSVRLSEIADHT